MVKKSLKFIFIKNKKATGIIFLILFVIYWFSLPKPLFQDPTCMVLEDKKGNLLGARIAADGQWRFPYQDEIPEKFAAAIVEFEDRRFYSHWGIDPKGMARAMQQNISNGRIVSGGSTLSMQVIRMATKAKSRGVFQKLIETIIATRLELTYSKKEILAHYASNAPFGGNVVGLDAASWRYFAKNPNLLSWSEAATLAVLPNSPGLIHPGRNRKALEEKRNRLLDRLLEKGAIDSLTNELAKEEPLPEKPHPLPRLAPHLLDRAYLEHFKGKKGKITRLKTTIDGRLQSQVTHILRRHNQRLKSNGIHNLAAFVVEVETGNVISYVGNVLGTGAEHGEQVDVIQAPRSTGSILKPILYALMLQDGTILPNSLIPDVPTTLSGYRPENFYENYDGVVTARRALIRSLNVPIIRMLQKYGLEKFHFQLNELGFSTINKPPDHYGLPLILGGAEATLWDITNTYTGMARTLNHFAGNSGYYDKNDFRAASYVFEEKTEKIEANLQSAVPHISASAAWFTFDAIRELERPNSEGEWQRFQSSRSIAWKTGTSFGFRDAWAVGVDARYAVGVWAGNADGEGRPGLVGVRAAAPVLFDIFKALPAGEWFATPFDEMTEMAVCRQSGYRALDICEQDTVWSPLSGLNAPACPYHRTIHTDATQEFQVNSSCLNPTEMMHPSWFVLPPVEEHYYKSKNPNYRPLPPFRADCAAAAANDTERAMQLIYPKKSTRIYVPIGLDGSQSKTVFKAAHRNPETVVYWHLDNEYVGETQHFHELELSPKVGTHVLTLVDELGNRLVREFEVLGK